MKNSKKIIIFIDSCAWDKLFYFKIDLAKEFPSNEFKLCLTREVNAFELNHLKGIKSKERLSAYIQDQIEKSSIQEHAYFGFCSYNDPPGYKSRRLGFNKGKWLTYDDSQVIQKYKFQGQIRPTGLYSNEADASLAVRADLGSVVLTGETLLKNGPLKKATKNSGRVLSLTKFRPNEMSLREFVLSNLPQKVIHNN